MKAAIGKLKPGYLRLPFYEGGDPSHGPFRDDLDPQWKEVMYQTYEKVAAKEPPWTVGQFMTNSHFPKASGATTAEYTDRNVIDFIKRKDHRGVQEFRITVSKKILQLGECSYQNAIRILRRSWYVRCRSCAWCLMRCGIARATRFPIAARARMIRSRGVIILWLEFRGIPGGRCHKSWLQLLSGKHDRRRPRLPLP